MAAPPLHHPRQPQRIRTRPSDCSRFPTVSHFSTDSGGETTPTHQIRTKPPHPTSSDPLSLARSHLWLDCTFLRRVVRVMRAPNSITDLTQVKSDSARHDDESPRLNPRQLSDGTGPTHNNSLCLRRHCCQTQCRYSLKLFISQSRGEGNPFH